LIKLRSNTFGKNLYELKADLTPQLLSILAAPIAVCDKVDASVSLGLTPCINRIRAIVAPSEQRASEFSASILSERQSKVSCMSVESWIDINDLAVDIMVSYPTIFQH